MVTEGNIMDGWYKHGEYINNTFQNEYNLNENNQLYIRAAYEDAVYQKEA